MIHEFCETCEGWVSYPASQEHICDSVDEIISQDEMNARGQLAMSADLTNDSDY